jgi:hypothetical protein
VNPSRLTGRPPFRFLAPVAALVLFLPALARAERGVELTPFAGFRFGGSFEEKVTGVDLDAREGAAFGLILGVQADPDSQYELFWAVQRTRLETDGLFGRTPLFDLDIHYLHIGGRHVVPGEGVRPFVSGGLGLTFFIPKGGEPGSKTRFSVSLGGGVKVPFSKRVGLRLEARGFLTILPESTEIFCVSAGGAACDVRVQGDVFGQVQLLAGISFGL